MFFDNLFIVGTGIAPKKKAFTYDVHDRLKTGDYTGFTETSNDAFEIDKLDNFTGGMFLTTIKDSTRIATVTVNNENHTYTYDNRGNTTEDEMYTYTWDDFNRLKTVTNKAFEVVITPVIETSITSEATSSNAQEVVFTFAIDSGSPVTIDQIDVDSAKNLIVEYRVLSTDDWSPLNPTISENTGITTFDFAPVSTRQIRITEGNTGVAYELDNGTNSVYTFSDTVGVATHTPTSVSVGASVHTKIHFEFATDIQAVVKLSQVDILASVTNNMMFQYKTLSTDTAWIELKTFTYPPGLNTIVDLNEVSCRLLRIIEIDNGSGSIIDDTDTYNFTLIEPNSWEKIEYRYDAQGRRVQKIVDEDQGHWYLFDGYQIIEERTYNRSSDSSLRRQIVFGTAINEPVYIYNAATDTRYYLLKDEQNSVVALYNEADTSGAIPRERYEYSAYGRTNLLDGNGTIKKFDHDKKVATDDVPLVKSDFYNPFGFQGMWRDEHTGLYHTHYRIYNPQHVRWLSPDPAGYRDGQNLYRFYAGPNGVDVLGLNWATESLKGLSKFFKFGKAITTVEHAALLVRVYRYKNIARLRNTITGVPIRYGKELKSSTIKEFYATATATEKKLLEKGFILNAKAIPDLETFVFKGTIEGEKYIGKGTIKAGATHLDDVAEAEAKFLGGKKTPKGWSWHHADYLEDSKEYVMQLVPSKLHDGIGHAGGRAYREGILALEAEQLAAGGAMLSLGIAMFNEEIKNYVETKTQDGCMELSKFKLFSAGCADFTNVYLPFYSSCFYKTIPEVTQGEIDAMFRWKESQERWDEIEALEDYGHSLLFPKQINFSEPIPKTTNPTIEDFLCPKIK